jgi:hypothetical protein
LEHGSRFVTGELLDCRLVHAGFPHIGVKSMPEIVKPEGFNSGSIIYFVTYTEQ